MAKSAEMVASIPDLLTEILLRLPIKSLLRFKSVSKRWFSLISDPRFCQLLDPIPNPAVGLFLPSSAAVDSGEEHHHHQFIPFGSEQYSIEFIKDHLPSGVRILHSCNGLMLCCSKINTANDDPEYLVFNPTTKKSSVIPKPDEISKTIRGMYLAFDPVKSFHYKIVSFSLVGGNQAGPDQESHQFQIKVYSSDTHSWLTKNHPFTSPANFDKGVYFNSAIHWMFAAGNDESFYFHVEDHTLKQMPSLPLTYSTHCKRDYYLGESCGHLQFIDTRGRRVKFAVYELRNDYSEWFVKYQVDLSQVVAANPAMASLRGSPMFWCCFVFEVVAVVRGGEDGDSFLILQIPGKVVRYNIVRKSFQDLMEFEGGVGSSLKYPKAVGFQYIRSLACV